MKSLKGVLSESILSQNVNMLLVEIQCWHAEYEIVTDTKIRLISTGPNSGVKLTPIDSLTDLQFEIEVVGNAHYINVDCKNLKTLKLSTIGDIVNSVHLQGKHIMDVDISDCSNINGLFVEECPELKQFNAPTISRDCERFNFIQCRSLETLDLSTIQGAEYLYINKCPKLKNLKVPQRCISKGQFYISGSGQIDIQKIGIKFVDGFITQVGGNPWSIIGTPPNEYCYTKDGELNIMYKNWYSLIDGELIQFPLIR